ncbi:hypothetical protein C0993_007135 [Termitomyces sp. T159_Od127]|nr:hypothetical protein C0993_007135 [Termitomyces sp. T159_Od127]
MYSDERTALSGDYAHSSYSRMADSYGPAYSDQWQLSERASARLVARDSRYTEPYYPPYPAFPDPEPPQQPPPPQPARVVQPPKRRSPADDTAPPKPKRAKVPQTAGPSLPAVTFPP